MEKAVNAFTDVFPLTEKASGLLSGLTLTITDVFDVAGCGNPECARPHPKADQHAPTISTLLHASACLVGKTHTNELAYSLMVVNSHFGIPTNTADPRRVPGGSSSGSAAAVTAGMVDIGLGSDTGGSVRLSASVIWWTTSDTLNRSDCRRLRP